MFDNDKQRYYFDYIDEYILRLQKCRLYLFQKILYNMNIYVKMLVRVGIFLNILKVKFYIFQVFLNNIIVKVVENEYYICMCGRFCFDKEFL